MASGPAKERGCSLEEVGIGWVGAKWDKGGAEDRFDL